MQNPDTDRSFGEKIAEEVKVDSEVEQIADELVAAFELKVSVKPWVLKLMFAPKLVEQALETLRTKEFSSQFAKNRVEQYTTEDSEQNKNLKAYIVDKLEEKFPSERV